MDEMLDTAPCGFLSFTDNGIITLINQTLLADLAYSSEAVLNQHINVLLPMAGRIFFQTHFFPLLVSQGQALEIYLSVKTENGTEIPMLLNAVRKQRGQQYANDCSLMVIHQRNEYEDQIIRLKNAAEVAVREKEKIYQELLQAHQRLDDKRTKLQVALNLLEKLATTDELTDLNNRRTFEETLSREIEHAKRSLMPVSLIIVDADHFKSINDTFGHPVGDRYLQQLAKILQSNVRKNDLVARYGGEEFVVVLPNTKAAGAVMIAEKLRKAVEVSIWPERPLTTSLGIATLSDGITEKAELLKLADQALYYSKHHGRNRVTHFNELEFADL